MVNAVNTFGMISEQLKKQSAEKPAKAGDAFSSKLKEASKAYKPEAEKPKEETPVKEPDKVTAGEEPNENTSSEELEENIDVKPDETTEAKDAESEQAKDGNTADESADNIERLFIPVVIPLVESVKPGGQEITLQNFVEKPAIVDNAIILPALQEPDQSLTAEALPTEFNLDEIISNKAGQPVALVEGEELISKPNQPIAQLPEVKTAQAGLELVPEQARTSGEIKPAVAGEVVVPDASKLQAAKAIDVQAVPVEDNQPFETLLPINEMQEVKTQPASQTAEQEPKAVEQQAPIKQSNAVVEQALKMETPVEPIKPTPSNVVEQVEVKSSDELEPMQQVNMVGVVDEKEDTSKGFQGSKDSSSMDNLIPNFSMETVEQEMVQNETRTYMPRAQQFAKANFESMIEAMRTAVSEEASELTLQLKPQHLGGLTISLTMSADGLMAKLSTANKDVQYMLNDQIINLQDSLKEKGVQIVQMEVIYDQMGNMAGNNFSKEEQRWAGMKLKKLNMNLATEELTGMSAYNYLNGGVDIGEASSSREFNA